GGGARREGGPGPGGGAGEDRGGGRKPKPAGRWLEHLARWGERLLSPLAAAVITVSAHDYREGLRHGLFDPRRAVVIPNGVADPRQAKPGPGGGSPSSSTLRIVMVARFEPPKDHATLLRAVALLDGHGHLVDGRGPLGHPNHDWVVELAGDGPALPEAVALARRMGIDHRVRFRGACPHGAGAFQDAAVAVLCTRREGLPLTVLEAMAAGVPVVATAVGGVPEAVRHGVTGFLVPPGDPAAVARYLATLLADPALRRRMGAAARARYEAHYTVDRMVAATLAVYRAACAGQSPGAGGPRGTVW
ncbi:MAG TPA: glycosyltransferase, partial [Thermaerobacter sp.]